MVWMYSVCSVRLLVDFDGEVLVLLWVLGDLEKRL